MICCVDVDYRDTGVTTACVGFDAWDAATARIEIVVRSDGPAPAAYQPGAFYERELPYLLGALERMPAVEAILVDAYVWLAPDRPGLGWHLYDRLGTPVVGVAKTRFAGADAPSPAGEARVIDVIRGDSARPLYVTAVGIAANVAADRVRGMHGDHRVPTLIRLADGLARGHR